MIQSANLQLLSKASKTRVLFLMDEQMLNVTYLAQRQLHPSESVSVMGDKTYLLPIACKLYLPFIACKLKKRQKPGMPNHESNQCQAA